MYKIPGYLGIELRCPHLAAKAIYLCDLPYLKESYLPWTVSTRQRAQSPCCKLTRWDMGRTAKAGPRPLEGALSLTLLMGHFKRSHLAWN